MKKNQGREFLEKRIDSKKFLSSQAKKKAKSRLSEVDRIAEELHKHSYQFKSETDLPRIEFLGAVEKYLFGFSSESVQNSINSVEFGLLVKLDAKLTREEKQEIYHQINREENPVSFTLGYMINLSASKRHRIIKGKIIDKLQNFNIRRNAYYHPINLINSLLIGQQPLLPEIEDFIKKYESVEKKRIMRLFPAFRRIKELSEQGRDVLEQNISYDWCVPNKVRGFMNNEIEEFTKSKIDEGKRIQQMIEKDPRKMLGLREYLSRATEESYMKQFALEALNDAFDILQHLRFF